MDLSLRRMLMCCSLMLCHLNYGSEDKKEVPSLEILPGDVFLNTIQFMPPDTFLRYLDKLQILSKSFKTKIEGIVRPVCSYYLKNGADLYDLLFISVEQKKVVILKHIMEKLKGKEWAGDIENAMHLAASRGFLEILKILEENEHANISCVNADDEAIDIKALKGDHAHVLEYIIDHNKFNLNYASMMEVAIANERCAVIRMLAQRYDVNKKLFIAGNYSDVTPLFLAFYKRKKSVIQTLLSLKDIDLSPEAYERVYDTKCGVIPYVFKSLIADPYAGYLIECPNFAVNNKIWMEIRCEPPLCYAVRKKNYSLVSELLKRSDIDPNAVGEHKQKPLMLVLKEDYFDENILVLLLDHPKTKICKVKTIVNRAFKHRCENVLKILFEKGALDETHLEENFNWLSKAVHNDWIEIVKKMVPLLNKNVNRKLSKKGEPVLIYAIIKNDIEMVKELFKNPHLDLNEGKPLARAAKKGRLSIIHVLLRKRDSIKNINEGDPIVCAINFGHNKTVKKLLRIKGIDINAGDTLAQAIKCKREELARIFLQIPNIDVNKGGPLARAAFVGGAFGEEMVRALLKRKDIEVNKYYPLRKAINKGHTNIIELLLADPRVDVNSATLDCAVKQVDEALINRLSKRASIDLCARYSLKKAAIEGDFALVKALVNTKKVDINEGNPLIAAITKGHKNIVQFLLEQPGIYVNRDEKNNRIPLYEAIHNLGMLELVLKHPDINVNEVDEVGNFALIYAVEEFNLKALKQLLAHPRIKKNKRNRDAKTFLQVANEHGFYTPDELLRLCKEV